MGETNRKLLMGCMYVESEKDNRKQRRMEMPAGSGEDRREGGKKGGRGGSNTVDL